MATSKRVATALLIISAFLLQLETVYTFSLSIGRRQSPGRCNLPSVIKDEKMYKTISASPQFLRSIDSLISLRSGSEAQSLDGNNSSPSLVSRLATFANKNFFLVGMFVAVTIAKLFPAVSFHAISSMSAVYLLFLSETHFTQRSFF